MGVSGVAGRAQVKSASVNDKRTHLSSNVLDRDTVHNGIGACGQLRHLEGCVHSGWVEVCLMSVGRPAQ